jgi:Tfp pilus assembly protein PilF
LSDALAIQEGRSDKTHAFQDPQFRGSWSGYERDCLFFNPRGPRFFDAGHAFAIDFDDDGRAVVPVDIDGDGDLDLALLSLQGLRLLENRTPARRFARLRLQAAKGDPQAIGARVTLKAGGVTQRDFVKITTGFATQSLLDLHFGLGTAQKIDEIEIRWRDGSVETHRDLPVDQRIVILQGSAPRAEALPHWPASSRPRVDGRITMKEIGRGPIVYQVGGNPPPARVGKATILDLAPDSSLAKSLKAESPSTFVFDPEGRLRRAFYRPVTVDEVAATINHMGQGTFHADFTAIATYHLSREEFGLAERALTRAIEMNPSYPVSHYYLGRLRGLQGRDAEAAASFRRAVVLDRDYRLAMHQLGVALYRSRQLAEALDVLKQAIALMDGAETRHVLGMALATSGRYEDAVTEMKRSVEMEPKRAEVHGDLGKVLLRIGRKAEAETTLKKALELNPNLAEARANLRKAQEK